MNGESSNFFRQRRVQLGLSRRDVADRLGITPACVGLWETGSSTPPIGGAKELAEVYAVSEVTAILEVARQARLIREQSRKVA